MQDCAGQARAVWGRSMNDTGLRPTLCLVRHGALAPNPERRFVGASDVPLSALGQRQISRLARELVPFLANTGLAAILSSSLQRCRESARILHQAAVALGRGDVALHHDSAFNEICLGQWEGLSPQEVRTAFPGQYEARGRDFVNFCPPGGESFAQVQQRVLGALDRWQERFAGKSLLLVGHAGVNRCILAQYLSLPLTALAGFDEFLGIPQAYASHAFLSLHGQVLDAVPPLG